MSCFCGSMKNKLVKKALNCTFCSGRAAMCDDCILVVSQLPKDAAFLATKRNHLNCLKFAYLNGAELTKASCEAAAMNGNLKILTYLHERKAPWDIFTTKAAVTFSNFDCLEYAHKNGCDIADSSLTTMTACLGNVEAIDYQFQNRFVFEEDICTHAAKWNKHEVLKYLHEHNFNWDKKTTLTAAKFKSYDAFKYAVDNGCEWNKWSCLKEATYNKHVELVKYITNLL